MQDVSLLIHYSVLEVGLDLTEDGLAYLVSDVQLFILGDPILLYRAFALI